MRAKIDVRVLTDFEVAAFDLGLYQGVEVLGVTLHTNP